MKEATGELSTTVITVVAIAAVAAIFTVFILPSIRANIKVKTYCSSATCGECNSDGKASCTYYEENEDGSINWGKPKDVECPCDRQTTN